MRKSKKASQPQSKHSVWEENGVAENSSHECLEIVMSECCEDSHDYANDAKIF
jgi:hypothetical protein